MWHVLEDLLPSARLTGSMEAEFEVARIIRSYTKELHTLAANNWKARSLYAISRCRTAAMGGHIDRCDDNECNRLHISYNSCRNRHCPKCQGHLRERWIAAREQELLNTAYFHVVFTLPHHLNAVALAKPALVYSLLFKTAWGVMKAFAADRRLLGAEPGMIAVLHTWGQNLSLHPHLHCIVPAGGMSKSGKWKQTRSKGKFLFPVKAMSRVFRAWFVEELHKKMALPDDLPTNLFKKPWVIYCKQPFHGPRQVIEYLGRYTHKVAISNHRITNIKEGRVSFTVKDYRKGGKKGACTLYEREFIRRFALHILPKGFTRIRHYGILSSTRKKTCKTLADNQLGALNIESVVAPQTMLNTCPHCRKGKLQTVAVFDKRGPPVHWMKKLSHII